MADNERPDKELIDAYLAGNQGAFEALYERYRKPLYSYLNKMLPKQTATVDDIFQTTWIKAVDHLDRYHDRQTFFAWLVRIGRNTAIDHLRRSGKRQAVDIDEQQLAAGSGIPWQEIGVGELARAIETAVSQLPPEQLEVFAMRQNDVPFKDIADVQGCSLNTALGRMHYAVNKLRQILKDWN